MPERFSEADAQRIFAAAAERQHTHGQSQEGLSLEELEEIGRAAGLDPTFVREAAVDALRPAPAPTTTTALGLPLAFRRERFIRGTVTNEAWAEIVVDLRRQFNKPGFVTDVGPLREWRSAASDQQQPVTVTLAPERDGTRIVISQAQANTALGLGIGTGSTLLMGLLFFTFANVETGDPGLMVPAAILLASALCLGLLAVFGMRNYSRRQMEKFDATLDRIGLVVLDSPPEPAARLDENSRQRRIDPSLLDAEADTTPPLATRNGTRL